MILSAKYVGELQQIQKGDRWRSRHTLVAMNQNLAGSDVLVNIIQCRVYNLRRYVIDIGGVHQIENQASWPPGDQIFRMVFRCGSPGVAQRLPVIRFFASMDNKPPVLVANRRLIVLRAYKQVMMQLNHAFPRIISWHYGGVCGRAAASGLLFCSRTQHELFACGDRMSRSSAGYRQNRGSAQRRSTSRSSSSASSSATCSNWSIRRAYPSRWR